MSVSFLVMVEASFSIVDALCFIFDRGLGVAGFGESAAFALALDRISFRADNGIAKLIGTFVDKMLLKGRQSTPMTI